jgi:hypothetical protein
MEDAMRTLLRALIVAAAVLSVGAALTVGPISYTSFAIADTVGG